MAKGEVYLPVSSATPDSPKSSKPKWPIVMTAVLALVGLSSHSGVVYNALDSGCSHAKAYRQEVALKGQCVQADPRMPTGYNVSKVWDQKDRIINWLSGAVQIPTEMYDEMGPVDEDPQWRHIGDFQVYLDEQFPLVHQHFNRSVHDWAVVYELAGTDTSLKPLFLTAHQDVVPVLPSTLSQWDQPPFSGHYDGEFIWGRGASDTKSSLTAIMGAIETMLEEKGGQLELKRGLVLGFGSDEERGGRVGAPAISKYLNEKYGKDSMAMLIDEGTGLQEKWGQQFALAAVAEKGHYDLGIEVQTLGGHSSVPPKHTGIGYMSALITELERHPHPTVLKETSPIYGYMTCAAAYASDMPRSLKKAVVMTRRGGQKAWSHLASEIVESSSNGPSRGNPMEVLMSTTQAIDIINGGLKVNALPESVKAVVNHRVDINTDHRNLESRSLHTLLPVAKSYNLTLVNFDGKVAHHGIPTSKVILSNEYGYYDEPAPISPTDASDPDSAWDRHGECGKGHVGE